MRSPIAYIDDIELNLDCIKTVLDQDFEVSIFNNSRSFLDNYETSNYAAILIDIHMPDIDGYTLYEMLIEHPRYNGCPLLFLSSDESDTSRIKSFDLGAVDYLSRSMSSEELSARIKSKISFFQKYRNVIEFSSVRVNLTLLKAYLGTRELALTFIEFKILCAVLRQFPELVTRNQLIDQVWRTDHVLDATIYTHVSNLNNKLSDWDYTINGLKTKGIQLIKKEKS